MHTFIRRPIGLSPAKIAFPQFRNIRKRKLASGIRVNLSHSITDPSRWRIPVSSILISILPEIRSDRLLPGACAAEITIGWYMSDVPTPCNCSFAQASQKSLTNVLRLQFRQDIRIHGKRRTPHIGLCALAGTCPQKATVMCKGRINVPRDRRRQRRPASSGGS